MAWKKVVPANSPKPAGRRTMDDLEPTDEALVECQKCERGGEDCGEHAPTWMDLALYWKAQCEASQAREASARAEGRREGIEEAAKVAEGHNILADASEAHHMAASRAKAIAAAIRALAEKQL